jgi:hypothetical protein
MFDVTSVCDLSETKAFAQRSPLLYLNLLIGDRNIYSAKETYVHSWFVAW